MAQSFSSTALVGVSVASIDARPSERAVLTVEGAIRDLRRLAELEVYAARTWRKTDPLYREWARLDARLSEARAASRVVQQAQAARERARRNLTTACERLAEARADFAARSPWRDAVASLRAEAVWDDDVWHRRIASAINGIGLKVAHMIEVSERQFELFRRHVHQFLVWG